MIHLLIHLLSKSIFQLDGSGTEMLRDIDIFSSYLKNIHDGIIIPQEIIIYIPQEMYTAAGGYEK